MSRPLRVAFALAIAVSLVGCASGSASDPAKREMDKDERLLLRKKLAFSLASHREWAAASRPLLELRTERPLDPEIHTLLGTVYREQGLFDQAEGSYRTAIRLDPRNARARAGLGILREVRGDPGDAALEDFKAAITLAPEEGGYHNNLGFALYLRGRYAEAEAAIQEGLRHDPLSRRMRNNLGFVYGRLGQFERARRAFEHGGTEDEVQNNLGYMHEQAADYVAACANYREALVKNPLLAAAAENARRACDRDKEGAAKEAEQPGRLP
jgi:Flp pilus assembly protein TadD